MDRIIRDLEYLVRKLRIANYKDEIEELEMIENNLISILEAIRDRLSNLIADGMEGGVK